MCLYKCFADEIPACLITRAAPSPGGGAGEEERCAGGHVIHEIDGAYTCYLTEQKRLNPNLSGQGLWIREHGPVFTGSSWLFPTRH